MRGWVWVAVIVVATLVVAALGIRALLQGRRVPTKAKLVIAGALVWLLSPLDPIPDFVPALGWLDDVTVLIAAVRYVLNQLEPGAEPIDARLGRRRPVDGRWPRLPPDVEQDDDEPRAPGAGR